MRQNTERRTALLDAAIEVLAAEGSRGLTFRAIDKEAAVPSGTASNYFPNRDALLLQAVERTRDRLQRIDAGLEATEKFGPSEELEVDLMRSLYRHMHDNRSCYLAVLELRLEATRRPELHAALAEIFAYNLRGSLDFNRQAGLPSDDLTVVVMFLGMTGLLLEDFTFPEVLADFDKDELIAELTRRAHART
ncbi:MAG: TetR family transcriptional regulator [Mycobacteriaceae bacterium]|nr:TetR family transcriptional regulator [Mycobacteriaceae bacterium]